MSERRKRSRWTGVGVAIVLLALYCISSGPAAWYYASEYPGAKYFWGAYWPLCQSGRFRAVGKPLQKYLNLWVPEESQTFVQLGPRFGVSLVPKYSPVPSGFP